MSWDELRWWTEVIRTLIVPLMGYLAYTVRDVRNGINTMNGRLGRMEEWRALHSEEDERRFRDHDSRMSRMEDRGWRVK